MSDPLPPQPSPGVTFLQQGQALEEQGQFAPAIEAYDQAIAAFSATASSDESVRRALGVTWMNRGNALQKTAAAHGSQNRESEAVAAIQTAVAAYDEAIVLFRTLPFEREPDFRNHLGAAWLNRGHALLSVNDLTAAIESFENAIAQLEQLPLTEDPSYRLNLAGARTNLAHVLLNQAGLVRATAPTLLTRARTAARQALELLADVQLTHVAFAEMSLRARRALVMTLGALLTEADATRQPVAELVAEASDAIDEGLTLARECEKRGASQLRPLTARLFRLGAQLYGMHQPQFLGEFLLENVDPADPGAVFASDAEFRGIADDALTQVLAHLHRPNLVIAGTRDAEKLIATARSLRAAQHQLSSPLSNHSSTLPASAS